MLSCKGQTSTFSSTGRERDGRRKLGWGGVPFRVSPCVSYAANPNLPRGLEASGQVRSSLHSKAKRSKPRVTRLRPDPALTLRPGWAVPRCVSLSPSLRRLGRLHVRVLERCPPTAGATGVGVGSGEVPSQRPQLETPEKHRLRASARPRAHEPARLARASRFWRSACEAAGGRCGGHGSRGGREP